MNPFLQSIRNFLSDPRKIRIVFLIIIVLGVGGLLLSIYLAYMENREQEISIIVNEKIKLKNETFKQWEDGEITSEDYTNQLSKISEFLYQIYSDDPSTHNGERAHILSAEIDFHLGYYTPAKEKLQNIINREGEMTPVALYILSIIYENQEDYSKAIDTLKDFQGKYFLHYLKPITMLTEARLYRFLDQKEKATEIYTQILQNEDFTFFYEKAEEGINLLEWGKEKVPTEEELDPNFGSGFEPEYLQTNQ